MAKTHLQKQTFTSKEFGLCHWEKKKRSDNRGF